MIIEKPSASGDRLSVSFVGQVAQRRILDQARHVAQLQRAELERVDAAPAAGRAGPTSPTPALSV